jgi:hypothetical protein
MYIYFSIKINHETFVAPWPLFIMPITPKNNVITNVFASLNKKVIIQINFSK